MDYPEGIVVPVEELERSYRELLELLVDRHGRDGLGDYLEFGVFGGASLGCMWRATEALGLTDVRLFGFDSFEGLPPVAEEEPRATGWEGVSSRSKRRRRGRTSRNRASTGAA